MTRLVLHRSPRRGCRIITIISGAGCSTVGCSFLEPPHDVEINQKDEIDSDDSDGRGYGLKDKFTEAGVVDYIGDRV